MYLKLIITTLLLGFVLSSLMVFLLKKSKSVDPQVVYKLMPLDHSAERLENKVTHVMIHFSSACDRTPETPYDVEK